VTLVYSPIVRILAVILGFLTLYMAFGEDVLRAARPHVRNYQAKYMRFIRRPVVVPFVIFVVLGILMRDWVLTPFLVLVAGAIAYVRIRELMHQEQMIMPRDILQLALSFRGSYQLQPAVFASLQDANTKVDEPLRSMVRVMVESFFLTASTTRAFAEFRKRTSNVSLNQFAYILEMSETASNESTIEALDGFVERLRRQEDLQNQVETNLTGITGQTSFIQILALGIAFFIAIVPAFRITYVGSMVGRLIYILLTSFILLASYYIERRIASLKEQVI